MGPSNRHRTGSLQLDTITPRVEARPAAVLISEGTTVSKLPYLSRYCGFINGDQKYFSPAIRIFRDLLSSIFAVVLRYFPNLRV
jgi:hypothetical protein